MLISAPGKTQRDYLALTIEASLRLWAKECPQEVLDFEEHMKRVRLERSRDRATSANSPDMGLYGEIPEPLYKRISMAVGSPHWSHDPATREVFWSQFQMGKVRRGARLPTHE